jgi:hypothetical protein
MWTGSPSQNLGLAIWPRVTQDLGQLAPLAPLFYGPLFGRGFRIGTASAPVPDFELDDALSRSTRAGPEHRGAFCSSRSGVSARHIATNSPGWSVFAYWEPQPWNPDTG